MNSTKKTELINLIRLYTRNWKLFVLSFLICTGFSTLYLFIKKPVFKTSASILVKEDSKVGMNGMAASMMRGLSFDMLGVGGGAVDDELEIIKSYSTLYNTVKELGLNINYTSKTLLKKEVYYNNSPVCLISEIVNMADTFQYSIKFKVNVDKDGVAKVKAIYKRKTVGESQSTFPVKISTDFGNFILEKTDFLKKGEDFSMTISYLSYAEASEDLMKKALIEVASKKSNVINLSVNDVDKKRGKDILNHVIKHYTEYGIDEKNIEAERTAVFLQERINLINNDLKLVEKAIEKYKTDHHLTNIEAEAKIILDKSSDFKEKLINAETQYSVISMIEAFIKTPENKYAVVPMSLGIEEKSAVESLLKYNELLLERLKLLRSTHPGNPVIESMNEQVDASRQSVLITIQSIKRGIEYARNDLRIQEQTFIERIKGMPQQEREYVDLRRQQEIKQAIFVYLLQQQEQNALKQAISIPKAQIIDKAFAYNKPVTPNKILILATAILFTILIPVLFLYFKRLFTNKFENIFELQAQCGYNLKRLGNIHFSADPIVFNSNETLAVEDIRKLRSQIYMMLDNSIEHQAILVSSMERGEGKSFISINLSLAIAKTGKKVLLIDTDLRYSNLSYDNSIVNNNRGIYQIVHNEIQYSEVIQKSSLSENLYILPAGLITKENPSETLLNPLFKSLIQDLKNQYDFVVLDSTALALHSDAMPIFNIADGIIFVTRASYTVKSSIDYIETLVESNKLENVIYITNDVKGEK